MVLFLLHLLGLMRAESASIHPSTSAMDFTHITMSKTEVVKLKLRPRPAFSTLSGSSSPPKTGTKVSISNPLSRNPK